MSFRLLTILTLLLAAMPAWRAEAAGEPRARARIERVTTPVAVLDDVRLSLEWPTDAPEGRLRLQAGRVDAGELGWRFENVDWQCPLRRVPGGRPGDVRWRCDGALRSAEGGSLRLAVELDGAHTGAVLTGDGGRLALVRDARSPARTTLDLRQVPAAWAEALVRQGWAGGQVRGGRLDGEVHIDAPDAAPLQIAGHLAAADLALESDAGDIASAGLGADLRFRMRLPDGATELTLDGALRGGEVLLGAAYLALPDSPVGLGLDAVRAPGGGWDFPRLAWNDGAALVLDGTARLTETLDLAAIDLAAVSADAGVLPARYLSGWLGPAGLSGLSLQGGFEATLSLEHGVLRDAGLVLRTLDVGDSEARFRLDGLDGAIRYSAHAPVRSAFAWRGGALYGMPFDAAAWSLLSGDGRLRLRAPVAFSLLGGRIGFEALMLQPPSVEGRFRMQTELWLEALDIGALAKALDLPAFEGRLEGRIPIVRYADNRIDFDGGLSMDLFGGRVDVAALSIERPFGVAPTVAGDLAITGLDLRALTGVFGFGSIEGRLHGRIDDLRLIDWTATAFDAELHTERAPGVRQRISQRAVQNISSVGDASFVTSLQGQLIGIFDDFGYRAIGISCRLRNEVCRMGGLRSGPSTFTIVEGAGLPRLDVVGHNRDVDWPTLVARLVAVAGGDVEPVFD